MGDRFTGHWNEAMGPLRTARATGRWKGPAVAGGMAVAFGGGFLLLARAAVGGELGPGQVTAYVSLLWQVMWTTNAGDDSLSIPYGSASVPAVLAVEAVCVVPDLPSGLAALDPSAPVRSVRFEGVTFRYPGRDDDVLSDLDLDIEAGRSLAIVGENGAGKTTLVKLLARLYQPTDGRITVDGTDLRNIDGQLWQRRVAAIFQDFVRYQLSLRDNVGLGGFEHLGNDDELSRALERAGAAELAEGLVSGWDTVLSRQYRDGTDLSGGQWQRVALARALFAVGTGARVLVLDEPTAELDVRAEAAFYDRFLEITTGLTSIVISHRFSTVRRADRIVVLEAGRIVEDGDHPSLVAQGGRYARMFELQASRFTDA